LNPTKSFSFLFMAISQNSHSPLSPSLPHLTI
jgi:hypothetical protein